MESKETGVDEEEFSYEGLDIAKGNAIDGATHHVFVREPEEREYLLDVSYGGDAAGKSAEKLAHLMEKAGKVAVVVPNKMLAELLDIEESELSPDSEAEESVPGPGH